MGILLRALGSEVTSKYLDAIGLAGIQPARLLELAKPFADEIREFELALERGKRPSAIVDVPGRFHDFVQLVRAEDGVAAADRLKQLAEHIPSLSQSNLIEAWLKVLSATAEGTAALSDEAAFVAKEAAEHHQQEINRLIALMREDDRRPSANDWHGYMHSEDYLIRGFIQSLLEFQNVMRFRYELRTRLSEEDWRKFLAWAQSTLVNQPWLLDAWKNQRY